MRSSPFYVFYYWYLILLLGGLNKIIIIIITPTHMKSWPKVKLGQIQVGSNIA